MTTNLNSPITLPCGVTLKNRIVKSAMTEGIASEHNRATDKHANLYRIWAEGGAGLLMTGNVLVDRRFLERPGNIAIDDNGGQEELSALAAAGRENGAQVWMQINHTGRQSGTGTEQFVSASENTIPGKDGHTRALLPDEIEDIISRFVHCARTAQDTGFGGVQIHAAHGYLISQFLSPLTNRRTDQWGGPLENRARFLRRIIDETRQAVGSSFPISVKLNSADFQKGGFTEEESLQVVDWLASATIDLLEISGGNYESQRMAGLDTSFKPIADTQERSTAKREAYFLEFAKQVGPRVGIPVLVTGGFRTRLAMEEALATGALDMIGLGRPLCFDPNFCNLLLAKDVDEIFSPGEQFALSSEDANGLTDTEARLKNIYIAACYHFNQIRRLADGHDTEENFDWQEQIDRHVALEMACEENYQRAAAHLSLGN